MLYILLPHHILFVTLAFLGINKMYGSVIPKKYKKVKYSFQHSLPTIEDFIVLSDNPLTVYKYSHLDFKFPRSTLPLAAKLWLQPPYQ